MPAWSVLANERMWLVAAMGVLVLAMLSLGTVLLDQWLRQARSRRAVERALKVRESPGAEGKGARQPWWRATGALLSLGTRWGAGRLGQLLMADEDRRVADLSGVQPIALGRALFVVLRVAASVLLPLLALFWFGDARPLGSAPLGRIMSIFGGFALGWMLPKWYFQRLAARRRERAAEELPLLVDLLRLLQGVGLSMDQSLQVVIQNFGEALPILTAELDHAVQQHARGRSREQSLQRLSRDFGNEDLMAICRLIVQVDQYGGAVQEPLQRFSERMRESRRLELKEKTGKLTVKMTGVMVLTLMPALLIITGGMGFLTVLRGLSSMGGGE